MCGIAGFVTSSPAPAPDAEPRLGRMIRALRHRGPDDQGQWIQGPAALGHARLAIIDLSPRGRQPMSNEDGSIQIIFNGEIYNFMELRAELEAQGHRFASRTDTEVLVHGYEQWGIRGLLDRIVGMFAFALWDQPRGVLTLARDPFGIKPLFYDERDGRIAFASEAKALIAGEERRPPTDPASLLLAFHHIGVPAPHAIRQGHRQLEPAHYLQWHAGRIEMHRYWHWTFPADIGDPAQARRAAWEAICRSVEKHLIADVPVALFLSGGLDSSLIAAACAEVGARPTCFTIALDDPRRDESPLAAEVCRHLGLAHRVRRMTADDARPFDARLAEMYDEPYPSSSALSTALINRLAAEEFKVVLSGDGGDELFGGYGRYAVWMARHGEQGRPASSVERARQTMRWWMGKRAMPSDPLAAYAFLSDAFLPGEMRRIFDADLLEGHPQQSDPVWLFRRHDDPSLRGMNRLQAMDLRTFLPNACLTKMDRASMAWSLEVRVPLLDKTVAQVCGRIDPAVRNPGGQVKGLLKAIAAEKLPAGLLNKPKQGFSTPVSRWFGDEQIRRQIIQEHRSGDWWKGVFSPALPAGLARIRRRNLWRLWHVWRWMKADRLGDG
jgi:asparagine synthase (glutamine-hydrolysing)